LSEEGLEKEENEKENCPGPEITKKLPQRQSRKDQKADQNN
jgi:hypothetical protein